MAPTAVLTRGLQTVRMEFDVTFPGRDHASDGWIGNLAHQLEAASGHNPDITGHAEYKDGDKLNEVRAIDVDKDLRDASGNHVTMEQVVQYLVKRARAGFYVPFRYLIFNGRIWSRSDGWKTRVYTGANKHDKHAHFSGDYTQKADNWTGSLGLATLTRKASAMDQAEKDFITGAVNSRTTLTDFPQGGGSGSPVGNAAWSQGFPVKKGDPRTPAYVNFQNLQADVVLLKDASAAISARLNTVVSLLEALNPEGK